jgi:hypothetical protein
VQDTQFYRSHILTEPYRERKIIIIIIHERCTFESVASSGSARLCSGSSIFRKLVLLSLSIKPCPLCSPAEASGTIPYRVPGRTVQVLDQLQTPSTQVRTLKRRESCESPLLQGTESSTHRNAHTAPPPDPWTLTLTSMINLLFLQCGRKLRSGPD